MQGVADDGPLFFFSYLYFITDFGINQTLKIGVFYRAWYRAQDDGCNFALNAVEYESESDTTLTDIGNNKG